MESLYSSETSVIISQSAHRNITEGLDLQQQRHHNVKCRMAVALFVTWNFENILRPFNDAMKEGDLKMS